MPIPRQSNGKFASTRPPAPPSPRSPAREKLADVVFRHGAAAELLERIEEARPRAWRRRDTAEKRLVAAEEALASASAKEEPERLVAAALAGEPMAQSFAPAAVAMAERAVKGAKGDLDLTERT